MIGNNARYEITAVRPEQYPFHGLPETAFAGRSNVGKSSIINSLLGRKNLARVGSTPGKTKEINFYNIDDRMYFVDLPGYGFATVSKVKKSSWADVVNTYLATRVELKLIILLVDIRHAPSVEDKEMYDWLTTNSLPHLIVATKADKIPRAQVAARLADIRKTLGAVQDIKIIPYSVESRQGKDELWADIMKIEGSR